MYMEAIQPDYLMIENVTEFMAWGPLDEKGKPVSKKQGQDYMRWVQHIKEYGYRFSWRELNAADFGAYTSRSRYFAQFAKGELPISWPEPTHAKNPEKVNNLFGTPLKKWKAVKEVLKLDQEGESIFARKKPLVENTLKRIYAGLVKFVANGDDSFIKKYYSGRPIGKVISVDGPAGSVTTIDGQAIVKCDFIVQRNGGNPSSKVFSTDSPARVVTATGGNKEIVRANFLQSYYGNGNSHSTAEPCPTVSTKDRFGKINYLMMNYSSGQKVRPINYPAGTVVNNDKHNLVSVEPWLMDTSFANTGKSIDSPAPTVLASRKHHYLLNPQYSNKGNSINEPGPTIIARQDKKPLGIISCEIGNGFIIPVYEDDCETMVKIKIFMAHFGIIDIKMRMLFVEELLRIQGFPEGYQLVGTQTDKKKFIGNSVEVTVAKKLFEAHHGALVEYFEKRKVA